MSNNLTSNAMTSIIWNHKFYHKTKAFTDFFGFVAWLVKNEQFTVLIDGRGFNVTITCDENACTASTSDHGGDNLQVHHARTRAEALEGLVEKLSEAIYEERI